MMSGSAPPKCERLAAFADRPRLACRIMETRTAPQEHNRAPSGAVGVVVAGAALLGIAALAVPGARDASTLAATADDFACGAALDARTVPEAAPGTDEEPARLPFALATLRDALYADDPFSRLGGEGTRTECRNVDAGTSEADDGAPSVTWRFDLEQVELVRTLDGGVQLNAFEARHAVIAPRDARLVAGSIVAETVSLPPASDWVPAPDGRGIVAASSARRAGASQRCRTSLVGNCTVALDLGWRLSLAGRALALEQTFWVNGRTAEHVRWRLDG